MKLHVALYIIGSLILLAAWVAQQRYNDLQAERRKADEEQSEARLAARLAEQTGPAAQLEEIRRDLAQRGAAVPPAIGERSEASPTSTEQRIREAIESIPAEVRGRQRQEAATLTQESRAQQVARSIDVEFRPRVREIVRLIDDIVSKAASDGLVVLTEKSQMLDLPSQLAYTTFTMKENGIQPVEQSRSMWFRFVDDVMWTVYWKNGMVRSPKELAPSWDAPTEHYYPMLVLQHRRGSRELSLGTVWFHQDSKELGFHLAARHEVPDTLRTRLEAIERNERGTDRLSAMLIELLKGVRLNYF